MTKKSLKNKTVVLCILLLLLTVFIDAANGDPTDVKMSQNFSRFAKQWMAKLQTNGISQKPQNTGQQNTHFMKIVYSAKYETIVQKTDSSTTPYIGILHYTERHFPAKDQQNSAKDVRVTEIFRFTDNVWCY